VLFLYKKSLPKVILEGITLTINFYSKILFHITSMRNNSNNSMYNSTCVFYRWRGFL